MAKKEKKTDISTGLAKARIKRKGVHAKSKASYSKVSKNYLKKYKGQGR